MCALMDEYDRAEIVAEGKATSARIREALKKVTRLLRDRDYDRAAEEAMKVLCAIGALSAMDALPSFLDERKRARQVKKSVKNEKKRITKNAKKPITKRTV